jgi:polynucleotide 5'-kinase involved in rRNA processing
LRKFNSQFFEISGQKTRLPHIETDSMSGFEYIRIRDNTGIIYVNTVIEFNHGGGFPEANRYALYAIGAYSTEMPIFNRKNKKDTGMKISVCGKGGSGKSTLVSLLANCAEGSG